MHSNADINTTMKNNGIKQPQTIGAKDDLYSMLCGKKSDNIEAFVFWLGQFCGNKGIMLNGDKYELMWYLYEDTKLWGGIKSNNLPLYTTKQLMKKYYDMYIHDNNSK